VDLLNVMALLGKYVLLSAIRSIPLLSREPE
jgi:hypothetical protein